MAEVIKIAFLLVLNIVLIAAGPIVIRRKRVPIGFGGRATKPIVTVTLTGIRATIFGIACIIGAIVTAIPTALFLVSRDDAALETALTIGIAVAFILIVGGFFVGGYFQLLSTMSAKKHRD